MMCNSGNWRITFRLQLAGVENFRLADTYPCNWPGLPERVILDEVQRAPGIFSTLKSAVDRHGSFFWKNSRRGTATA